VQMLHTAAAVPSLRNGRRELGTDFLWLIGDV
jgi:hypothetical protein